MDTKTAWQTLRDYAEGRIGHTYAGSCPDHLEGHDSRDPECLMCQALEAVAGAAPAAVAGPTAVELQMLAAKHTRSVATPTGYVCDAVAAVKEALARWGAAPALEAPAAPVTLMTEDQASKWAWDQIREEVGTKGWTAGDSCNFFGFFLHGWNYRGQYELQRPAALARAALAAAPQAPAAPILGDAERLAAARQDKSLADYWRNRVAGLAEEFTKATEARYLADRIVSELYDLPTSGVARPAAPAAPAVDGETTQEIACTDATQRAAPSAAGSGATTTDARATRCTPEHSAAAAQVARDAGFNHGVCLALQIMASAGNAGDAEWTELLDCAGREEIMHYARHVETESWLLCGFAAIAAQAAAKGEHGNG